MAVETKAANRRSSIAVKVEYKIGAAESLTELTNVSDIPDLGGAPEQIDVTAIGDLRRKFINGIIEQDELEFTCFYEEDAFKEAAKGGQGEVVVTIYSDNKKETEELKVTIKGQISASLAGFGVGDAINYTMRVAVEEIDLGVDDAE